MRAWTALRPLAGRALLVVFLLIVLSRALPTALGTPPSYGHDQGAVDHQDGVTLVVGDIVSEDLVVLSWDWNIADGVSKPTLYASVHTSGGSGTLIFTGPISARVTGCRVDAIPTNLVRGRPGFQVRGAPAVALVNQSLVTRIDFDITAGPPGGPVIYCDLQDGYSSDDPPYHQFYTPELRIAVQGTVKTDRSNVPVCASRSVPGLPTESECVRWPGSTTAVVPMSIEELNRPAEQGLRDARLIIVGVLAGLVGQAVWELGRQLLPLGRVGVRKLLVRARSRQRQTDKDDGAPGADTPSVSSSTDSAHVADEGDSPPASDSVG